MTVEIQPLPSLGYSRIGESSTSKRADDIAIASKLLWDQLRPAPRKGLVEGTEILYVAIAWPDEKRLDMKRKSRNLIVEVQQGDGAIVSHPSFASAGKRIDYLI